MSLEQINGVILIPGGLADLMGRLWIDRVLQEIADATGQPTAADIYGESKHHSGAHYVANPAPKPDALPINTTEAGLRRGADKAAEARVLWAAGANAATVLRTLDAAEQYLREARRRLYVHAGDWP